MVQEFVKSRYSSLSKQVKDLKAGQLLQNSHLVNREDANHLLSKSIHAHTDEKMSLHEMSHIGHDKTAGSAALVANMAATPGSIIDVVEEALKWRLEANNKKTQEQLDDFEQKLGQNKRILDMLSEEVGSEIAEIKNQIV